MVLLALLLLSSVSLIHSQRIANTKVSQHDCQNSDLSLIKSYFEATTINRGDSIEPVYCITNITSEELRKRPIDLYQLVDFYISLQNTNTYTHYNPQGPIINDGVLSINDYQVLPLWHDADIRSKHLAPPNSYPGFRNDVKEQMDLMGSLKTDDWGYLLPHSLGGPSRALNMIPMARNVNWHLPLEPEDSDLGSPRSNWRSHENWIRRFLLHAYPNGRVAWKLAVQYEDQVLTDPAHAGSYRPLSFSLQYYAFSNEHDGNSIYYISPHMTFLNDNDYSCADEIVYRRRQFIHVPSSCTAYDLNANAGTIGSQVSRGQSEATHVVSFPLNIQGKTYVYSQSDSDTDNKFRWSIQKILSTGEMGEEASSGYWNESYPATFPYFINGRQYFYAHNIENRDWFIRELLPGGKMGEETSHGKWLVDYPVSFPFTINGKHYFYGQRTQGNHRWFIQELLSNGRMGGEISTGTRNESYPVVFPYSIKNRHMFYAHNPETKNWFVQELLPEGKIGKELNRGQWKNSYHVSFSYNIGEKYYFYGLNASPGGGHRWFIQELLPNGQMSSEISSDHESTSYSIAFPFSIHNKGMYLYKHSNEAEKWTIHELL